MDNHKILMSNDDYDIHQGKPISKADGTLRYFLSLKDSDDTKRMSDVSVNEIYEKFLNISENSEPTDLGILAKLPKDLPTGAEFYIEKNQGWTDIPLGILEHQRGINELGNNRTENIRINDFIKKQGNYGEDFKRKYTDKLPEEFYDAFDVAWRQKIKSEVINGVEHFSHV